MNSKIHIDSVCMGRGVMQRDVGTGLIANVLTGVVTLADRICMAVIIRYG